MYELSTVHRTLFQFRYVQHIMFTNLFCLPGKLAYRLPGILILVLLRV